MASRHGCRIRVYLAQPEHMALEPIALLKGENPEVGCKTKTSVAIMALAQREYQCNICLLRFHVTLSN